MTETVDLFTIEIKNNYTRYITENKELIHFNGGTVQYRRDVASWFKEQFADLGFYMAREDLRETVILTAYINGPSDFSNFKKAYFHLKKTYKEVFKNGW